jgi:hypothetical protein
MSGMMSGMDVTNGHLREKTPFLTSFLPPFLTSLKGRINVTNGCQERQFLVNFANRATGTGVHLWTKSMTTSIGERTNPMTSPIASLTFCGRKNYRKTIAR